MSDLDALPTLLTAELVTTDTVELALVGSRLRPDGSPYSDVDLDLYEEEEPL